MQSGGSMLSFNRGVPIAIALNKDGEIQYTIHVTPDKKDPDLSVDNLLDLIDEVDLRELRSKMKLGRIEIKMLKQALGVDEEKRRLDEGSKYQTITFKRRCRLRERYYSYLH